MEINVNDITLRDMKADDIDHTIRWNFVDTEWMDWDAPWEKDDPFHADAYRRKALEKILQHKEENQFRYHFEIDYKKHHIGSVNAYHIDEQYNSTIRKGRLAIGIDIKESKHWGKGIGGKAFIAFITYLLSCGYDELYTQTWSGNERMIHMAERLGFALCHRDISMHLVRGRP